MDTNCGACGDLLTDGVNCTSCCQALHYHCAGITESGFRKLGDRKLTWRCMKCKQSSCNQLPSSPKANNDPQVLSEIRALSSKLAPLKSLTEELKALRSEFAQLKSSVDESNDAIREFNSKINSLEQRVVQIEKLQDQVNLLQVQVDRMEHESNVKDQWARVNNIEIKGIRQDKNEDLFKILSTIGNKIQYPVQNAHVNFITRVPTREKDNIKPIIVCFTNRYVKENFIAAARMASKLNPLTSGHLGLTGHNRIFINDHLTTLNKLLLSKAKKIASEKDFQYIWVKYAKIHVRKNDTSPIFVVKSEKDLTKLL
ncbi:uncharacterized protein LOC119190286 [Manduca sexta]|uniref:uncharacterized protein LOC119190286 n=1 Tax=Manduca sexta TaxID=7130 RepID=UPI00188F1AFC|nr:uncharacterized protein LOC119190286 [Manduca sexta]